MSKVGKMLLVTLPCLVAEPLLAAPRAESVRRFCLKSVQVEHGYAKLPPAERAQRDQQFEAQIAHCQRRYHFEHVRLG